MDDQAGTQRVELARRRLLISIVIRRSPYGILPITRFSSADKGRKALLITRRGGVTTETRTPAEASEAYAAWLERQPLAANTRRTYRVRVAQYWPVAKFLTKCYIVPDNYEATALQGAR